MANLKDLIVNGSARILGTIYGTLSGNATTATTATKIKVTDHSANNATYYPLWVTGAGASVDVYNTTSKLKFNPSTGVLTSTSFAGSLTGNVTGNCSGSSGSCTGNAATATKATQDSDGNQINTTYVKLTGTQTISGAKTFSTNPTISSTGINITGGEPVIQKSGINFIRRTDALILSANNNSIIMRPKGDTDGTNQATLDNTGNLTAVKFTGTSTTQALTTNTAALATTAFVNRSQLYQYRKANYGTSGTIDLLLDNYYVIHTISPADSTNITVTFNTTNISQDTTNGPYHYTFEVLIDQLGSTPGSVSWPSNVYFDSGAPDLSSNGIHWLVFRRFAISNNWWGSYQGKWSHA